MTSNSSNKKKPRIIHTSSGHTENGKPTKEHRLIVKTADKVFNSPSRPTADGTKKKDNTRRQK